MIRQGWRGRFYEDFEVGDVYQHPLGRTVTETDNTWFTLLTMNTAQIHFNNAAGEASEFGRCLVNSTLTLAIVAGQSVIDTSFNAIANLGWEDIKLTRPVFAGDTLYSETTVLNKRESRSRPHAGLVQVTTRGLNQDGEQVLSYTRTFLVHKSAHVAKPGPFPALPTAPRAEASTTA
ncbi:MULTISPECIES: MaoC family dehydratase [Actinomycetes]|uniref:MaoC family dehydratase n=1 Tax=Actinomycetes TaxID=1760 RepID=UPI0001DEEDAB|nr:MULTISPECIES: MaoC family dehydratase [Actinomycetes]EFL12595.1 dehydratase [Streptomyces sp. AA4]